MNAYQRYKKILELWETHTAQEVADKLGMSRQNIYSVINRMREEGIEVPYKKIDAIKKLKEESLKIKNEQ